MAEELLPFCECGCGLRVTKKGNRYISGHNRRGKKNSPEHNEANSKAHTDVPLSPEHRAAVSAGTFGIPKSPEHCANISAAKLGVQLPPRTPEHCANISKALTDVPHTPEHCAATSAGKTGIPHTPEQIAAIKKGQEESGMYEVMRGGNDIVNHHWLYDEFDLSLNTVQMTRSDHTKLHWLFQKIGYKVPHINIKEESA